MIKPTNNPSHRKPRGIKSSREMNHPLQLDGAYSLVARTCGSAREYLEIGNRRKAKQLLGLIINQTVNTELTLDASLFLKPIIDLCQLLDELRLAEDLVEDIKFSEEQHGTDLRTGSNKVFLLGLIASAYFAKGETEKAKNLLPRMRKYAKDSEGIFEISSAIDLVEIYIKTNQKEEENKKT